MIRGLSMVASTAAIALLAGIADVTAHDVAPVTRTDARVAAGPDSLRWVTADTGNVARYRVREQLVGLDFPNDAVGVTSGVVGALSLAPDGKVLPGSKFTIDVSQLKSDKSRRDSYVQNHILDTKQYPTVLLAVTGIEGLKFPMTESGPMKFELKGRLTVHGTTKPTTWKVSALMDRHEITGHATTAFRFHDFDLTRPSVAVVLSVQDTIRLEYDFRLVRK